MSMESNSNNVSKRTLFLLVVVVGGLVYWYTSHELRSFKEQVIANVDAAEATLMELAETTGNARTDETTEMIVRDCSGRVEYETLLSSLDSLTREELLRVENLYGDCSWQPTMNRALMAHRLTVALEEFQTHLNTLSAITGSDMSEEYQLPAWRSLVEKEVRRAELLGKQNSIQGRIIDALVANEEGTIPDLLQEAQSVNGSLNVTSIQINTERAALKEE